MRRNSSLSKRVSNLPLYLIIFTAFLLVFSFVTFIFVFYLNSEKQSKTEKAAVLSKSVNSNLTNAHNTLETFVLNRQLQSFFAEDYTVSSEMMVEYLALYPQIVNIFQTYLVSTPLISEVTVYTLQSFYENPNQWFNFDALEAFSFYADYNEDGQEQRHFYEDGGYYFLRTMYDIANFKKAGIALIRSDLSDFFSDAGTVLGAGEYFSVTENGREVFSLGKKKGRTEVSVSAGEGIGITIAYNYSTTYIVLFCGFLLVLAGLFVFTVIKLGRFGRVYSGKIDQLMSGVNRISAGEDDVEISVDESEDGELALLARCINHMVKELKESMAAVYEKKIQLKQAELELFQSQINPHFLYNILSMMNWKALERENDELSAAIAALSNYYRTTLAGGKSIIYVSEELGNVESYLYLQSLLKEGKVEYSIDVVESVKDTKIPKLILQPLVENSIEHGFSKQEKINIKVRGYIRNDECVLEVSDDGAGIDAETLILLNRGEGSGYALRNIYLRLDNYFEGESTFRVESVGAGATVRITYPYR